MDILLQVMSLKGQATHEALAAAVEVDPTDAIAEFTSAGLVDTAKLGYRLTQLGKSRVDELYAHERDRASPVIEDVYESFMAIDEDVKQIVADWQMRRVGGHLTVNDHSDHRHDDRVIARLRRTDAKASTAIAPLTTALSRFDLYPRRLRRALSLVDEGDHTMLAAPLKDSYHTVWFELHEDLIILSGRNRTDEGSGGAT